MPESSSLKSSKQSSTCTKTRLSTEISNWPTSSSTITCKSKWVISEKPPNSNSTMRRKSVFAGHSTTWHLRSCQVLSVTHMKWTSGRLESSVSPCCSASRLSSPKMRLRLWRESNSASMSFRYIFVDFQNVAVPSEAKDFIKRILVSDPKERMNIQQML